MGANLSKIQLISYNKSAKTKDNNVDYQRVGTPPKYLFRVS